MRDMLGGFPVRDLDFTVEGNALKLVKMLTQKHGATMVSTDELARSPRELRFEGGVTVELAMARRSDSRNPARARRSTPATIHEDLRMPRFHGERDRSVAQ